MKNYKLINNIAGWLIFLIATITYMLTIEPTTSFWDCGEFIATAYKLEVGHPPGAPLFMIFARFFSLFAGDTANVAVLINAMSALASSFTILFLFWTITHLGKKIVTKTGEMSSGKILAIMGSGVVGALAYTFSDSFWFSATEGEVYATSSLFTAIVFWAILKWENVAHEKYANRWIILIAYLMGLSIGIHLLNLLAIPAIVFVYYFKKYPVTKKGIIYSALIAVIILGVIMYGIIPGIIVVATWFELLFVNSFGLPFNSGVLFYILSLIGLIIWGLHYTSKKKKVVMNTIILGFTVILIGYSSFTMIVIRSLANPPMDENNPENVFALLSYLNREQYGDRPLVSGQYFNAPITNQTEGKATYIQKDGKYVISDRKPVYEYDDEYTTVFPRMWSPQKNHVDAYMSWGGIKEKNMFELKLDANGEIVTNREGNAVYDRTKQKKAPSFGQNLKFFFTYQIGHMYFRYFMWNFAGRQNDIQGHGDILKGNWISGIPFIDEARLGPQDNLPKSMTNAKAKNTYFMLPFLLGLIGLLFQAKYSSRGFIIVLLLFFFTGIAIVIYLNQYPYQPRERDYAYSGSFYAFAIWIGLGVMGLYHLMSKKIPAIVSASLATIVTLFAVPVLMANQNWDDHSRANRYTARDFAHNYLETCAPNAIIFTNGDNDTFPLWYAQEVEGIRTDVRVVNLSLLNTDWYIDQMKRKAYDSDAVPFSLTHDQYLQGSRDIVYLMEDERYFREEKYNSNKDKFENRYKLLFNNLLEILRNSSFAEIQKADMKILENGHKTLDILKFVDLIKKLSQNKNIEIYKINKNNINQLNDQTNMLITDISKSYLPVKIAMNFVASDESGTKLGTQGGEQIDFIPTKNIMVPVDSALVVSNGTVREVDADKVVKSLDWRINKSYVLKSELMILDLLATNNWKRPVYFAITVGSDSYLKLEPFFQLEGLAYRLVPIKERSRDGQMGRIASDIMYNNLMNKFKWGNISDTTIYLDENNIRMTMNIRNNFARLSDQLIAEGKIDSALNVLDKCMEIMPHRAVPYNVFILGIAEGYYKVGKSLSTKNEAKTFSVEKANDIIRNLCEITEDNLDYYFSIPEKYAGASVDSEIQRGMAIMQELVRITSQNGEEELNKELEERFQQLYVSFSESMQ